MSSLDQHPPSLVAAAARRLAIGALALGAVALATDGPAAAGASLAGAAVMLLSVRSLAALGDVVRRGDVARARGRVLAALLLRWPVMLGALAVLVLGLDAPGGWLLAGVALGPAALVSQSLVRVRAAVPAAAGG